MPHSTNPADHKEHNPADCDFARIWLIQQWIKDTHLSTIEMLTNEELTIVGFKSCVYSNPEDIQAAEVYAQYDITQQQLFDFSEYVRMFLMNERGLAKEMSMRKPPDVTKVYLN